MLIVWSPTSLSEVQVSGWVDGGDAATIQNREWRWCSNIKNDFLSLGTM